MQRRDAEGGNEQDAAEGRRGRHRGGAVGVVPSLLTRHRIDGQQAATGLESDLHPAGDGVAEGDGRGPVGELGPVALPAVDPGGGVKPEGERLGVVFDLGDDGALDDEQRRRHAEGIADVRVVEGQGAQPDEVAIEIEGNEIVGGEQGEHLSSVGGRGVGGHRRLRVTHGSAGGEELALPQPRAVRGPEGDDVEPGLLRSAGTGHEDAVAGDDGRGQSASGQRHLPGDVASGIQGGGQAGFGNGRGAVGAAELRPVGECGECGDRRTEGQKAGGDTETPEGPGGDGSGESKGGIHGEAERRTRPAGSVTRSWNSHSTVQSSTISFWVSLTRIALGPARRRTGRRY